MVMISKHGIDLTPLKGFAGRPWNFPWREHEGGNGQVRWGLLIEEQMKKEISCKRRKIVFWLNPIYEIWNKQVQWYRCSNWSLGPGSGIFVTKEMNVLKAGLGWIHKSWSYSRSSTVAVWGTPQTGQWRDPLSSTLESFLSLVVLTLLQTVQSKVTRCLFFEKNRLKLDLILFRSILMAARWLSMSSWRPTLT